MMKCRDLYLQDVYQIIDKHRINNLRNVAQERYESIELKAEDHFEDEDIARSLAGLSPKRSEEK